MKHPTSRVPWDDYLAMHMREIGVVAVVLVGLAVACLTIDLPGGTELSGRVTSGGKTVVYGTVTVVASDDRVYTAPIGPDGLYRVKNLPPGPVRVAVSSPNPRAVFAMTAEPTGPATPARASSDRRAPRVPGDTRADPQQARDVQAAAAAENVAVAAPNGTAPPFPVPERSTPRQDGWFRIPGRYASPVTSGLGVEVRRGRTPLDLRLD